MTRALDALGEARPVAKTNHRPWALEVALRMLLEPGGAEALYQLAPRFDDAGVFEDSDWADPSSLRAGFVAGTLHNAHPHTVAVECLSQLRMLAIALGDIEHDAVSADDARTFLEDVIAHNLDLLLPSATEATRVHAGTARTAANAVFRLVSDRIGLAGVAASLVDEAERVLAQRPILVNRVTRLLDLAEKTVRERAEPEVRARVERLLHAERGPTPLSRAHPDREDYRSALAELPPGEARAERLAFAASMRATGLVCPHHAVLLEHLQEAPNDEIAAALALNAAGRASLDAHEPLVRRIIDAAVFPETARCIYGLARVLERGVLYFHPAATGLRRLLGLDVLPDVAALLRDFAGADLPANAILTAGALQVLGQPLGVGQGDNPTCQAARAISLWSQSDAGFLLELIARVARDGEIVMHFEGAPLVSSQLEAGLAEELHTELDIVSLVLVPHLDRIYAEMSRLVDDRDEDGHKWINPEFHGWWVRRGFCAAVGEMTGQVTDFDAFMRTFYAAYHPDYNGGREVVYPQPAGIAVTDHEGVLVGWHAVSIQRVEDDPDGEPRVYFYNPNDEGRQDWGQGVVTSTAGHGEEPGESSLPFYQYAARTYVFHYEPRELGDPAAVPDVEIERVQELARSSWAAHLPWP